jgi:hypothetical protein
MPDLNRSILAVVHNGRYQVSAFIIRQYLDLVAATGRDKGVRRPKIYTYCQSVRRSGSFTAWF